ncbi:MAG TPA: sodium:proton antiporter, partial [Kofleriaceae bacterium]|nr:sodium:proton antiporter [Kofleriaceae bacterium]
MSAAVAAVPFVLYLLAIAALPLVAGAFWESNRNKLIVAVAAGLPVAAYLVGWVPDGAAVLAGTAREYVAFITLLGALFVIAGGIHVRGVLAGTPAVNTALLAVGAVLANGIGTTGASALLIRPVLRASEHRRHRRHVVIFFIFIVSNGGGLLSPLGDPPLFLGFLRGVPFSWTLRLAGPWAVVNLALLAMFAITDGWLSRREPGPRRDLPREPLRIEGKLNLAWLLGVVATVVAAGTFGGHGLAGAVVQSAAVAGF